MKWYESARIHFGWVRYGEELTPEYANQIVNKTTDLGADTLAFCVQVGGYALWDSQVTPREEELGEFDLIGELAKICTHRGLYFVPWWLGTAPGTARVLSEHPTWQQVGPPQTDSPGERYNFVCYNSPYRELLHEEIREIISCYGPDGIYFNQLPASCHCPWCRAKYERLYGHPMPIVADEAFLLRFAKGIPPALRVFREESIRSFCKGVRRIIDETKPDTCYIQDWLWDFQSDLAVGSVNVALPEFYQNDDLLSLGEKCRVTKAYFANGPVWSNVRHAVDHDARYHPLRATKLLLANCVSNMASPLLSEQDVMDFDSTGIETLSETMEYLANVQSRVSEMVPTRYAALVHSKSTYDRYPERFEAAFGGIYRLLSKSHIPFEVVTEQTLLSDALLGLKVLILPDVVICSDEIVQAIKALENEGIGIVATHMTGLMDEDGRFRSPPAFSELFGYIFEDIVAYDTPEGITRDPTLDIADLHSYHYIWHYGSLREINVLQEASEDRLFGFLGGFLRCHELEDVQVIADILTHDQFRMNARSYNRRGLYPGPARWPLAMLKDSADKRSAFFTAQIEAEWRRAHAPQLSRLFVETIRWVGGDPPYRADALPWSVDIRSFIDPAARRQCFLIVNLSTDPPKDLGRGPGVFEEITPQHELEFMSSSMGEVNSIKALVGDIEYQQNAELVRIKIPVLDLYEFVEIQYG